MDTKVFLRHKRTKLYYSGRHGWTRDLQQAKNFRKQESAVDQAARQEVGQLEVVIMKGDAEEEKVFPIIERG